MPVISKGGLQLAGRSILTRPRTSHFMGPSSTIQDPKPCVGLPVERVPPQGTSPGFWSCSPALPTISPLEHQLLRMGPHLAMVPGIQQVLQKCT